MELKMILAFNDQHQVEAMEVHREAVPFQQLTGQREKKKEEQSRIC
jgi:hypothetical protein